jgi:queuine tRNA-ribosyltransferase
MIQTLHGKIETPAFLPDATYGTVKALSFSDVASVGIHEIVTTTLHIEQKLGSEYIKEYGGLHKFFGWDRPILTDSGGFQVFSLIHRRKNNAHKITDAGCSFLDPATGKYQLLTPEISQIIQQNLDSDIRVVLDEPVAHDGAPGQAKSAVGRTTMWARRAKEKFLELHNLSEKDFNNPKVKRPLLVAVIQGGNDFELRRRSAEELQEIGFDIYGFGGLPLHKHVTWREGGPEGFYHELLEYVGSLVKDKPRYGLGIGTPDDLVFCSGLGWDIFDTVLPTRNARHGYLYVPPGEGDTQYKFYDVLHLKSDRYKFDDNPIASTTAPECKNISRAYLRHLIRIKDAAGSRLATLHNLHFYASLMHELRADSRQLLGSH